MSSGASATEVCAAAAGYRETLTGDAGTDVGGTRASPLFFDEANRADFKNNSVGIAQISLASPRLRSCP